MLYPTKPKGGWQHPQQVVVNKSTAQIQEKKATQKFTNKYKDIFQKTPDMVEGHRDPQGPYFYQEGGKTYASLPLHMLQGVQQSPLFGKMKKDCAAEGIEILKEIMAQDPRTHVLTPQDYLKNVEAGIMPPMCNHNILKEMAEKADPNNQTRFIMMEFWDLKCLSPPKTLGPPKQNVFVLVGKFLGHFLLSDK